MAGLTGMVGTVGYLREVPLPAFTWKASSLSDYRVSQCLLLRHEYLADFFCFLRISAVFHKAGHGDFRTEELPDCTVGTSARIVGQRAIRI